MGVVEWDQALVAGALLEIERTEIAVGTTDETSMRTGGMAVAEVGERSLKDVKEGAGISKVAVKVDAGILKADVKVDVKEDVKEDAGISKVVVKVGVKEGAGNLKVGEESLREGAEDSVVAEARALVETVHPM